jgi:hypothetical protein
MSSVNEVQGTVHAEITVIESLWNVIAMILLNSPCTLCDVKDNGLGVNPAQHM